MNELEFNGTLYEPIFATSRSSIYYYNKDVGLWIRKKKDGKIENDEEIYLGSVGHNAEFDVLQMFKDLDEGLVKDLIPEFVVGREPFGIGLEGQLTLKNIVELSKNRVILSNGLQNQVGVHRGHTISEIYREFHPLEEFGLK